ncbi:hypothetical protein E2542_SST01014 [Spatholobus suberectus]|nr:hypothetical protein E2542_SST01014 [Spatholobus suberectus]
MVRRSNRYLVVDNDKRGGYGRTLYGITEAQWPVRIQAADSERNIRGVNGIQLLEQTQSWKFIVQQQYQKRIEALPWCIDEIKLLQNKQRFKPAVKNQRVLDDHD